MTLPHLTNPGKALLYASKTLLGCLISWFVLRWAGIEHPVWSVITVFLISDPDVNTTLALAKARTINTAVGCSIGMLTIWTFGYSPLASMFGAALTVLIILVIDVYPSNWRLAPATVVIVMDAGRDAATRSEEMLLALVRLGEIAFGCAVAIALAWIYTRIIADLRKRKAGQAGY
ncbi:MAG: FUSC family protein [Rhizobiales bacterium]|nr:FUSC family protein [Hyphomicrobiales bacterium]OJY03807.1 MAG: FUSC family protein [Rhizobiales bacterium 63-22]